MFNLAPKITFTCYGTNKTNLNSLKVSKTLETRQTAASSITQPSNHQKKSHAIKWHKHEKKLFCWIFKSLVPHSQSLLDAFFSTSFFSVHIRVVYIALLSSLFLRLFDCYHPQVLLLYFTCSEAPKRSQILLFFFMLFLFVCYCVSKRRRHIVEAE